MITVSETLTLDRLRAVKILVPDNVTDRWQGIGHAEMVEAVRKAFDRNKWALVTEVTALSSNEANLAASWGVKIPGLAAPKGFTFSVGVMTNNEKRRPLEFYCGLVEDKSGRAICFGTVGDARRNTGSLVLEDHAGNVLDDFRIRCEELGDELDAFKTRKLNFMEADHYLMQTCRQHPYAGRFPWGKLYLVEANRSLHGTTDTTACELLLDYAGAVKTSPPYSQMLQLNCLRALLPAKRVSRKV